MMGRLMILLCWLSVCVCRAEHAVYTRTAPKPSGGIISLFGGDTQRLEVYHFKAADTALCVVDEGDGSPRYGSLEEAMRRHKCSAGINGGYFGADAARKPIGLVRHGGFSVSPLSTGGFTVAGVVYDTGQTIRLERSSRLSVSVRAMHEAIQGGPFLVEQGRVVPGLEKTRKASRTFIATDGAGNWCLAVSSPLTLHELAEWLVQKGCMGHFRVHTALNLDGGSSCAFWEAASGVNRPGLKAVRNYVGVRPRALSAGGAAGSTAPAR